MPLTLPTAVLTVHEGGTVDVRMSGAAVEAEASNPPWRRESVPSLLDSLRHQWPGPIRVEVHEVDGSVFTDIVVPHLPDDSTQVLPDLVSPTTADPAQWRGGEPAPGEEITVAVVIGHGHLAPDGSVSGLSAVVQTVAGAGGEVVLIGRTSGAHTIRPTP